MIDPEDVVAVNVNSAELDKTVSESSIPVVVDFWAPWCGPCKQMAPVMDKMAEEFENEVVVLKVNVDENSTVAARFSIRSIPTVIVFKDGKEAFRATGFPGLDGVRELCEEAAAL